MEPEACSCPGKDGWKASGVPQRRDTATASGSGDEPEANAEPLAGNSGNTTSLIG